MDLDETNKISNEERKKYLEQFAVNIKKYQIKKENDQKEYLAKCEASKPKFSDLIDGYKKYLQDLGPGFIELIENYNMCLSIAKQYEILGNCKLKARIKDFSSSLANTDIKELDDVFGIEVITPTELEKEFLMLFNHLAFNNVKDKKYNKTETKYKAYHHIGDYILNDKNYAMIILSDEDFLSEIIADDINRMQTVEYKSSKKDELVNSKDVFPVLKKEIKNPNNLKLYTHALYEMLGFMRDITADMTFPFVESHFITSEVEENALRGSAQHSKYKKTNHESIIKMFKEGKLIRGINAPWKFVGDSSGLHLQNFYDTLLENWPFLKPHIVERRMAGKEEKDKKLSTKFDYLTATVYPFLRKYLSKPKEAYSDDKKDEIWGVLKTAIRIARPDAEKSLEDEFVESLDELI